MKQKYFTKQEGYRTDDLVLYARDHMLASQYLFEANNPYFIDSAGYLSHMGIELLLKAWALHRNGQFLKTHRLDFLIEDLGLKRLIIPKPMCAAIYLADSFENLKYPSPHAPQAVGGDDWDLLEPRRPPEIPPPVARSKSPTPSGDRTVAS